MQQIEAGNGLARQATSGSPARQIRQAAPAECTLILGNA